jgi:6,7-dimethyl-8-ribityllumazine synthase
MAGSPSPARIAYVQAGWHRDLTDRCRRAFDDELAERMPDAVVEHHQVPGALEIPLRAQQLAATGRFDAVVASALVVDGGIYRHEFVAQAVLDGIMRVQLDSGVPVLSAVLTPHHFHEHGEHTAFFGNHLEVKGREVAAACHELLPGHRALVEVGSGS